MSQNAYPHRANDYSNCILACAWCNATRRSRPAISDEGDLLDPTVVPWSNHLGVEFGTSYLVFAEREFIRFAVWFDKLSWQSPPADKDKLYIQVQDDTAVMLSLAPCELHSLAELLKEGLRWLTESSVGSRREVVAPLETLVN